MKTTRLWGPCGGHHAEKIPAGAHGDLLPGLVGTVSGTGESEGGGGAVSNGLTAKEHTAAQLDQEDIDETTLILTMKEEYKGRIWSTYEKASMSIHWRSICICPGNLPELYGEPLTSYGKCYELLAELLDRLAIQLNEEVIKR